MLSRLLLALTMVLLCALGPAAPAFAGFRPNTPSARSRFAQLHPGRLRPTTSSHGGGARFFRMGAIPRPCVSLRSPFLALPVAHCRRTAWRCLWELLECWVRPLRTDAGRRH
jgi:hypothetical protein